MSWGWEIWSNKWKPTVFVAYGCDVNQRLATRSIADISLFTLESALRLTPKQHHIACTERLPTLSSVLPAIQFMA